jgi:hypothetical protein
VLGRERVELEWELHTTMIHGYILISPITFNPMAYIHSYHSHIDISFSCDTSYIYIYICFTTINY